jgi:replicative DNA helicase
MGHMTDALQSVQSVLEDAEARLAAGERAAGRAWASGFTILDTYLTGGFRAGELVLFGGPQGLGKTTWALQVARNIAERGDVALYFSFEHDAHTLLERLVAAEAGEIMGVEALPVRRVREALELQDAAAGTLEQRLEKAPGGVEAVEKVRSYASRLFIHRSSGSLTDLDEIRRTAERVRETSGDRPVIIVDYLQKVPVLNGPDVEAERVTRIVEGLKDLALELEVPVMAIVAAEKEGLVAGKRLRVGHLRGSSALAYEADVVLILNDKYDIVARHHLIYNTGNAERFRGWAVLTIEKNRSGLDRIELEFRKRFEQGRFDTDGQPVAEQLVDERVYVE